MKIHFFRASMLSLTTAVVLGLTACGGGGGDGGSVTSTTSSSGSSSKGPFKEGSTVVAYKLNSDGTRDVNQTTLTTDGKGTFSFSSLGWSGPTEFVIYGDYLNENTGTYMTLPQANGISAVANITAGSSASVNINVLTNIAAKSIIAKMAAGADINTAKTEAETSVKELFNLNLDAGVSLDDLDPTDASQNTQANTQLLLVSSAILNTSNPEQVMQTLADDMSDGEVDDAGLAALDEVKEEVTNVDLQQVAVNLEEADIGVTEAPSAEDVLNGTLSFDHNMSFASALDAYTDTDYTSNAVTVNGIIGESGAISIENGSYSIDNGPFVTEAGTIANGQTLKVRAHSSNAYSTKVTANVIIGGGVIPYTVTTMSDPYVADTTPDAFDFGFKRDQAKFTNLKSDIITITGINQATPVSISGGDAKFSINGAAFTTNGNVNNNDTLQVQVTSGDVGTQTSVIVTVGDVNGTFNVFTIPLDTTPDAFTFTDVVDVNKTATPTVDSNTITITGINTDVPISVDGGEMNVNGVGFTTTATTINPNDTLVLRAVPSDDYETTATVTVTVGNVIGTFNVTTMSDPFVADTTPNEFSFTTLLNQPIDTNVEANITVSGINSPTPVSITNGSYVVNGGSQDANVSNGDVITVTQHTATSFDTETVTTLTIGGVSGTFKTKTLQEDKIPDDFSFDANLSVPAGSEVISNSITITGITTGTTLPISVENGYYDINGTGYTDVAGSVSLGDVVTLKQTAASTQGTSKSTTLTVGSTIRSFTTKTVVNAPAIAGTPATTVAEDSSYIFEPTLGADSGEVETWSITNKPSWAIFNTLNGRLEGTPHNADVGTYTDINITATNAQGSSSIVIASLEVTNTNDAPVAEDINASTNEDIAVDINITSSVTDVDVGDTYSITALSTPSFGSVTNSGNIITYTPALNAFGTDSFTYTVADANGSTATATVHVTVVPVDDPTIISGTSTIAISEDTTTLISQSLTVTDVDANATLVPQTDVNATYGKFNVNSDGSWSYLLDSTLPAVQALSQDEQVNDILHVSTTDGEASVDLNVTIIGANDAPVVPVPTTIGTIKKGSDLNITLTATDVDNGAILTLLSATATDGTNSANVTITDAANGLITFNAAEAGTYILSYTFSDEYNATVDGTHTVLVTLSDAPVATADTVTIPEDTNATIDVLANDTDDNNAIASVEIVSEATNGVTVVETNNSVTYRPNPNFNGTDYFTYKVTDEDGGFDEANVTVTITAVNDAPAAVDDVNTTQEDTNITFNVVANDSDADGDDFNITAVSQGENGSVTFDVASGTVTYSPDANFNGVDTFAYTISDGTLEDNATVTITVTPVNDRPVFDVALADITVDEDSNISLVDINVSDPDDDNLTLTAYSETPNIATATIENGKLKITLVPNAYGTATIDVNVSDGTVAELDDLILTVNPVNDAPTVTDKTFSTLLDTSITLYESDLMSENSDVDNNISELYISQCDTNTTAGVSINYSTDAGLTYTPNSGFSGTDTFECLVSDGNLSTAETISIVVSGNHAPTIQAPVTLTMTVGETLSGQIVANDVDENDTLTFELDYDNSDLVYLQGSSLNADGTYTITASAVGEGTLAIIVTDDGDPARSASTTVDITVVYPKNISDAYNIWSDIDQSAYDAYTSLVMPKDIKLYGMDGVNTDYNATTGTNTATLGAWYLEFMSDGTFSDSESNGTWSETNNIVTVNMGGADVAEAKMLDLSMSSSDIASELPTIAALHMPADAVVYKVALHMLQEEYDLWEPARIWIDGNEVTFASLSDMIDNGAMGPVDFNKYNSNRMLMFSADSNLAAGSGTVVEVDMTDAYQNGGEPTIINPNAGSWSTATPYVDNADNNITMVMVTLNAGVDGYGAHTILVDSGAVLDDGTSTLVMKGEYRPAGYSIEYYFNDIAMAVIQNAFSPVKFNDYENGFIDANLTELNTTTFDALGGLNVDLATASPVYDTEGWISPEGNLSFKAEAYGFDGSGGVTSTLYTNGALEESENLSYTTNADTNTTTISMDTPIGPLDVVAMKVLEEVNATALSSMMNGLVLPSDAVGYKIAYLDLVDADPYFQEVAIIGSLDGTVESNITSLDSFITTAQPQNDKAFMDIFGKNVVLAFADGSTASSSDGNLTAINLDDNTTSYGGTWKIESLLDENDNAIDVLVITPVDPAAEQKVCFALIDGIVMAGELGQKAGTGGISYMLGKKAYDTVEANFLNQMLLPFSYPELAGRTFSVTDDTGAEVMQLTFGDYYNNFLGIAYPDGSGDDTTYSIIDGDIMLNNGGSIIRTANGGESFSVLYNDYLTGNSSSYNVRLVPEIPAP
ncbi:tandem-95 repeat protein [Sulfurimonas sp. NWX79]|uniref:beta strand repeat-containing protein n=1 Tax=Sulfurimonas sp. NWX79 TaxID=2925412 RepID=UPI003204A8FA